jgi:hypothetical protein
MKTNLKVVQLYHNNTELIHKAAKNNREAQRLPVLNVVRLFFPESQICNRYQFYKPIVYIIFTMSF